MEFLFSTDKKDAKWIAHQCAVNVRNQLEYCLDPLITERLVAILDLTEFCIGQQNLQDAFKNMAAAASGCPCERAVGKLS